MYRYHQLGVLLESRRTPSDHNRNIQRPRGAEHAYKSTATQHYLFIRWLPQSQSKATFRKAVVASATVRVVPSGPIE